MAEPPSAADRPTAGAALAASLEHQGQKRPPARSVGALRSLLPYLSKRRVDIAWALLFLAIAAAATLALPIAARRMIDNGFSMGGAAQLNQYFIALGGVAVVLALASAFRFYFVSRIGERVVADLRADVFDRLMGLSPGQIAQLKTGEALSRLTTDAALIETLVGSSGSVAIRSIITAIGALAVLVWTSPSLAGLLLLVVPVAMVAIFAFGRRVRRLSTAAQDRIAEAAGSAAESLDAVDTIQAFGREDHVRGGFRNAANEAYKAAERRIRARAFLTAAAIMVIFGGVTGVLWLGAHAVITGDMTPGTLTQFVLVAIMAAGSAGAVAETWGDVQKAAGATERLIELLHTLPLIAAPPAPKTLPSPARGELAFENVSFAYPSAGERSALKDFTLAVKPGETVALVGPSGAGKSTVFRLLLRFYDPEAGAVRLDHVDARDVDPREWRSSFAYVGQDAALFSGTALDNVRVGRADANEAQAESALRRAEAWNFLNPRGGLAADLGDRGRALSGGERQRMAIARALVRDAPVLLLDEATSALDAENERLIQRALNEARKSRTTLIIAHRLATILQADRIVVMDGGRVAEEGTHTSLIARGGLYARLAALQFATDEAEVRAAVR